MALLDFTVWSSCSVIRSISRLIWTVGFGPPRLQKLTEWTVVSNINRDELIWRGFHRWVDPTSRLEDVDTDMHFEFVPSEVLLFADDESFSLPSLCASPHTSSDMFQLCFIRSSLLLSSSLLLWRPFFSSSCCLNVSSSLCYSNARLGDRSSYMLWLALHFSTCSLRLPLPYLYFIVDLLQFTFKKRLSKFVLITFSFN